MIEGLLLGGGPVPREVFLGEINEGAGDGEVIRNKSMVEVGETQKGVNIFDLGRGWPLHYAV